MSSRAERTAQRSLLTPAQCRAARGLLNWDQTELSSRSGISRGTIIAFESETRRPIAETIAKLRTCFETHGVRFIAEGGQVGAVVGN